MLENSFDRAKSVHFIGIGGIGISAIARMLLLRGVKVSGSDRDASRVTEELMRAGAIISIGHNASHIPTECECVVYTVAIPENNPELEEARKRDISIYTYPQTLEIVSKEKYTIALSGTHGKTTTTAMVASILVDAGLDPTVIVGSMMKHADGTEGNFIAGKSNYFVVEADEYKKSFHNLYPKILVINNIDEDHLDFYKDLADIQDAFIELAKRLPEDGVLICNTSDPHVAPVIQTVSCRVLDYESVLFSTALKIPGQHNRSNAKAAFAVAGILGVKEDIAKKSLENFEGVWRRFEYKGITKNGVRVYDDYAHNPQKVRAVLAGAKEFFTPNTRVIAVFQPHLYSRTKLLLNEFSQSFKDADSVILTPIYAAREAFDPSISSEVLAKNIQGLAMDSFEDIEEYLKKSLTKNDVLITIGAGDVYKIGEALLDKK